MNLQSEFFIPLGIERGAFDRRGPDKLGRKCGVEAVALLPPVYDAAVARTVAVVTAVAAYYADGVAGSVGETRSVRRSNLIGVAAGRNDNVRRHHTRIFALETQTKAGMLLQSLDGHHGHQRVASLVIRRRRRRQRRRRQRRRQFLVRARHVWWRLDQLLWRLISRSSVAGTTARLDAQHAVRIAKSCNHQ